MFNWKVEVNIKGKKNVLTVQANTEFDARQILKGILINAVHTAEVSKK